MRAILWPFILCCLHSRCFSSITSFSIARTSENSYFFSLLNFVM